MDFPSIGDGGYTKNGFFEFHGGKASMKRTYESGITYEHVALPAAELGNARKKAL